MKIAMVTGSYPPNICGVGDYTFRLVESLRNSGIKVEVFSSGVDWCLTNVAKVAKNIAAFSPDLIHIQYPSIGFGARLSPQVLSLLLKPCIVTIHEVSQAHFLRKFSLYPFTLGAEHILFTSDFEMNYSLIRAPWLKNRSSVIPIGSFISASSDDCKKDLGEIVYFGLIRPDKGAEEVLRLAYLAKDEGFALRIRIIGSVDSKQQPYLDQLQSTASGLPILWELGLPEPQVANLLARSRLAYMPFPDGASERRSSLLALLLNGVVTVSTKGKFTTTEMADALALADSPEEALRVIRSILTTPEKLELMSQKACEYAQRHNWENISIKHLDVYCKILQKTKTAGYI